MTSPARHELVPHTGEVELRLEAPSLAGLFVEAGRALCELLATELPAASGEPLEVTVRAPDRALLLAGWLDELIFLSDVHKRVFSELEVVRVSDTELTARVRGAEPAALRTAVKAATLHRLSAEEAAGGWRATVVLDV